MKYLLCCALILLTGNLLSQNIQLHYDLRHSLDPKLNPKNFPSFSFEYFKNIDTLDHASFLLKLDSPKNRFSAGSKINVYYHLLSDNSQIQFYPTLGLKYQF